MTTTAVPSEVVGVRVAGGTWRDDLRAVRMVWKRELVRFFRNRLRVLTSMAQPVLYLFVLGTGLSSIVDRGATGAGGGDFDYRTFMFPGVIAMTILFNAIFSAVSIVWDREFGFLREMLVAPVRRAALVGGKVLGGASVAAFQGVLMLALAGLVDVGYSPLFLAEMVGIMAMTAIMVTSLGVVIAARLQQVESFQAVMQFFVLPLFFLSGAMFPLRGLPGWLSVLTRIDPLSYAVDPMRRAVFARADVPDGVIAALSPGITWNGWRLPVGVELAVVAAVSLVSLALAVRQFSKVE